MPNGFEVDDDEPPTCSFGLRLPFTLPFALFSSPLRQLNVPRRLKPMPEALELLLADEVFSALDSRIIDCEALLSRMLPNLFDPSLDVVDAGTPNWNDLLAL